MVLTPEQVGELKKGPVRHTSLPAELQEVVEWTFEVVGRYFHPTLEQWEVGFLRDIHPDAEIRV